MTEPPGLLFASGEPFATGAARYFDNHPDIREPLSRVYVKFIPEGTSLQFIALLDTGGHYCILNKSVVDEIGDRLKDAVGPAKLRTAHGLVRGELYIHRITMVAELGDPLGFEATVFVSPDWQGPCLIGYTGALDRLCFAVHPRDNRFYFGPLE